MQRCSYRELKWKRQGASNCGSGVASLLMHRSPKEGSCTKLKLQSRFFAVDSYADHGTSTSSSFGNILRYMVLLMLQGS